MYIKKARLVKPGFFADYSRVSNRLAVFVDGDFAHARDVDECYMGLFLDDFLIGLVISPDGLPGRLDDRCRACCAASCWTVITVQLCDIAAQSTSVF